MRFPRGNLEMWWGKPRSWVKLRHKVRPDGTTQFRLDDALPSQVQIRLGKSMGYWYECSRGTYKTNDILQAWGLRASGHLAKDQVSKHKRPISPETGRGLLFCAPHTIRGIPQNVVQKFRIIRNPFVLQDPTTQPTSPDCSKCSKLIGGILPAKKESSLAHASVYPLQTHYTYYRGGEVPARLGPSGRCLGGLPSVSVELAETQTYLCVPLC